MTLSPCSVQSMRFSRKRSLLKLPDHVTTVELANRFATYFARKIQTIRDNLTCNSDVTPLTPMVSHSWNVFSTVGDEDLCDIITKAPCPSCILDPVPSWMMDLLDSLFPTMSAIVNSSLRSGVVPNAMKEAVITMLLKKTYLDHNILKNYRLVATCLSCQKSSSMLSPDN